MITRDAIIISSRVEVQSIVGLKGLLSHSLRQEKVNI